MENKRILIVDDNEDICKSLMDIIRRLYDSIVVDTVNTPKDALKKINNCRYDLILLDINLGEGKINGLDILKIVKEKNPLQNVYMMTGYGTDEDMINIINNNALGLINKPFLLDELVRIISCSLGE